jgi:hypothetical protein
MNMKMNHKDAYGRIFFSKKMPRIPRGLKISRANKEKKERKKEREEEPLESLEGLLINQVVCFPNYEKWTKLKQWQEI